jgi:hypothetical protein
MIDDIAVDVVSPNGRETRVLPESAEILDLLRLAWSSGVVARRTVCILGPNPELATRWLDAFYCLF